MTTITWTPVTERLPDSGAIVLACYLNPLGKWRRIRAQWIKAKTIESGYDSEIGEYDEATDEYYDPEGWDEFTHVAVYQGTVTHWMPLPEPPKEQP